MRDTEFKRRLSALPVAKGGTMKAHIAARSFSAFGPLLALTAYDTVALHQQPTSSSCVRAVALNFSG